jgi:hypothetical protein
MRRERISTLAIEKLLWHKARRAEELLKLGVQKNEATHAVAQINDPKRNSLTYEFARLIKK